MRIACPSCAATYDVPDRLLAGPARTLRCSRCGADFPLPRAAAESPPASPPDPTPHRLATTPEPPADVAPMPAPSPPPLPEPLAPRRPAAEAVEAPSPALLRAWVASIVVVAAAIVSLFVFQAKVMEAWPASTRLFAALGLA